MAEERFDISDTSVRTHLTLLLQVAVVSIVADVVACVLTDTASVPLCSESFIHLRKVQVTLYRV